MAKEIAETQDKDTKAVGSETQQEQRQERVSVRDSINAAIEEHSEIESKQQDKDIEEKEDKKEKKLKKDDDTEVVDTTSEDEDKIKKEKKIKDKNLIEEASEEQDKEIQEQKEPKVAKAPAGLPKDIKDTWATLPPNVQQFVTRINKESADQKAAHGRDIARYKEMDAAIAPYLPSIQQLGVTPAQTVDRLFQWMNALAGPSKYQAIQQLAGDFGIDLQAMYMPKQNQQQNQNQQQQDNTQQQEQQDQVSNTDPRLVEALQAMYDKIYGLEENTMRQREQVAAQSVNNWAGLQQDGTYKNKPYFPQVRQMMFTLLSSGSIPTINGNLDLDAAYDQACYAIPEIRQLIMDEQEETKQAKLEEARQKKALADKAKLSKAKSLNVSLKPASPTGNFNGANIGANIGANKQRNAKGPTSVRDSILSAVREVVENN